MLIDELLRKILERQGYTVEDGLHKTFRFLEMYGGLVDGKSVFLLILLVLT